MKSKRKGKRDKPVKPVKLFQPKPVAGGATVDLVAREERRAAEHLRAIMAG